MFGGINPREMQKAMKRMGIAQQEIDAHEVIIKTSTKTLIVRNPQVLKVNMMGQETLQVSGSIEELEEELHISDEDVAAVVSSANCGEEEARKALAESKGDIAAAILLLQS